LEDFLERKKKKCPLATGDDSAGGSQEEKKRLKRSYLIWNVHQEKWGARIKLVKGRRKTVSARLHAQG